jgi:hypothetical protein
MDNFKVTAEMEGAHYFHRIYTELGWIAREIAPRHPEFPFDIGVCIRCRSKNYPRKTRRRFDKKQNRLGMDIAFVMENVAPLLRCEQRHLFGHTVFNYIKENIEKYTKPSSIGASLIKDLYQEMRAKGWLEEEPDYSNALDEE